MLRRVLTGSIRIYRGWISPWTPPSCRYQPTCSAYALEAVERHGSWKGMRLALGRILRCHPWGGSGWDPVPPLEGETHESPARDAGSKSTTTQI